jgi:hypothetical protein
VRAGGGEFRPGEPAGGHADRAGSRGQRRGDVERGIPDDHGRRAAEIAPVLARRIAPRQVHELGPDLVRVAIGARVQVEMLSQAQRA